MVIIFVAKRGVKIERDKQGKRTFSMSLGAAWFPVEKGIDSQLSRLCIANELGMRFSLVGFSKV